MNVKSMGCILGLITLCVLKDVLGDGVVMPIGEYPNFEQLERAGQTQLPPGIEELARLIKQVSQKS